MHIMRAFICVNGLEVHCVPDDMIFGGNPIAAMHVPRDPRDIERLAAIIALNKADHFRRPTARINGPADGERGGDEWLVVVGGGRGEGRGAGAGESGWAALGAAR